MKTKPLLCFALTAFVCLRCHGKGGTNSAVFAAAAQGDLAKLKEFFAADSNLLSSRNALLRTAALNGQKDTTEFLIALGADVNEKGFFDMAPLAHLAMYGTANDERCAEVATILLAHGAEVDPVDQYGATPLLRAVEMKKSNWRACFLKMVRVRPEPSTGPITRRCTMPCGTKTRR